MRMISVSEAQEQILYAVTANELVDSPLLESIGLVLAESPVSELDMPPFDKAAVDGYAVVASDAVAGRSFRVVGEVMAGGQAHGVAASGQGIRIMTGAPVPPSAETVIMLETTRVVDDRVEVLRDTPAGRNVCRQGEDVRADQPLLEAGTVIGPQHIGLLAGQGCTRLRCHRRPTIAVLATGDEIVPPEATPTASQIRNANNAMLVALARSAGGEASDLGIAADSAEALSAPIARGLEADVLLCSGGVSAGALDLVPDTARALGVERVFHHVALQPGRPVFYGRRGASHFFGLPGNPVASAVCFKVLVEPLLRRLAGYRAPLQRTVRATFEGTFKRTDDRTRYVGVELVETDGKWTARGVATHGPADLSALARSTGLAVLGSNQGPFQGGEDVEVLLIQDRV